MENIEETQTIEPNYDINSTPIKIAVWEEKIYLKGEDAEPIIETNKDNSCGILAVADGLGGSGSTVYVDQGFETTGAQIAARMTAEGLRQYFNFYIKKKEEQKELTNEEIQRLKKILSERLKEKITFLEKDKKASSIKNSFSSKLPTTLSSIYFYIKDDKCKAQTIWAGDSRSYLLTTRGLQQLTLDDTKEIKSEDKVTFNQDSPLSNYINADKDFSLGSYNFTISLPTILIVATDGCYGYELTPGHFEFLIINTLINSNNPEEWGEKITKHLRNTSGDDFSMAIIGLGWKNFEIMKLSMIKRQSQLLEILNEINTINNDINENKLGIKELQEKEITLQKEKEKIYFNFWNKYKAIYEEHLKQ